MKKRSSITIKQKEWFDDHKVIRISKAAHRALLKYAGMLQSEIGEKVDVSTAIEAMLAENSTVLKWKAQNNVQTVRSESIRAEE